MNKDELVKAVSEAEASNNIYERIEGTLRAVVHYLVAAPVAASTDLSVLQQQVASIEARIGMQGDPENPEAPGEPFQIGDAVSQLISDVEELYEFLNVPRNGFTGGAGHVPAAPEGLPRDVADLFGEEGI